MKKLNFTKAVATGNDFVIVDNRTGVLGTALPALSRKICDRHFGVGSDGLLIIERSKRADFMMRIFNSDGSEAEMCGNGSRCAALYASKKGVSKRVMTIETRAGLLKGEVKDDLVKVMLTEPKDIQWNLCLMIDKCPYKVSFVNTGVPHTIHFVDDIKVVDVKSIGSHIRHDGEFSPGGTNVNFVKITGKQSIAIRTYERGVEDETLACGTGAVASAIISAEAEKMASPITVETKSGEKLKIYFNLVDNAFHDVYLEGRAALVFDGTYEVTRR